MKKMTKDDIRALKKKHRLELVMQETGEVFEVDSKHPDQWHSTTTAGLSVDTARQLFEIKRPGQDVQSGDVIDWLQLRYRWNFAYALSFLQKRPADPEFAPAPKKQKSNKRQVVDIDDVLEPVDHWQRKALELGGERIRSYFSRSHWSLIVHHEEVRIEPIYIPYETHCQRCEKKLDWVKVANESIRMVPDVYGDKLARLQNIPVIAYSIKKRLRSYDLGFTERGKLEDAFNDLIEILGDVYIDDTDGIVCADCAWKEYLFQCALALCEKSARLREEAEEENKTVRDSAAGREPANELL